MAISFIAAGAWDPGRTSVVPALPAAADADTRMVLFVGAKPYNATIGTPTGWTLIGTQQTNGTVANGVDTGSVTWSVFYRDWVSGDAAPTVSITSGDAALGVIFGAKKTAQQWDTTTAYFGSDTTSGTAYSITAASSSGNITVGDGLIHATVIAGNNATFGTPTITATGATLDAPTEYPTTEGTTALGNNLEASAARTLCTAGPSTADAVCGWTLSAAQTGGSALVRLRESSNVTLALTGSAVTSAAVPLALAVVVGLTGSAVTGSGGTLATSRDLGITGSEVTTSAGILSGGQSLTGSQVSSATGVLSPATSNTLTGSQATSSAGATVPGNSKSISGESATATAGTLTASPGVVISGAQATASTGTLSTATSNTLTGTAIATYSGTISAVMSVTLTGISVTTYAGTVTGWAQLATASGSYSVTTTASTTWTQAPTASGTWT